MYSTQQIPALGLILAALAIALLPVSATAASGKATGQPAAKGRPPARRAEAPAPRRLTLLPALSFEQYSGVAPLATNAADLPAKPPGRPDDGPWLELETGWCVAFLGSSPTAEPGPERPGSASAAAATAEEPFCQLAAGVRYAVAPGAKLNLGYQLPNKTWSNIVRPLGVDLGDPDNEKKISIGIDINF